MMSLGQGLEGAFNPLKEGDTVAVKRVELLENDIDCDITATVSWRKTSGSGRRFGISGRKDIDPVAHEGRTLRQ